jgi:M3 family oligoendopeptidase
MKIPRLSEMQIHEPSVGAVEAAYADLLVKLDRADSAEAQIAVIEEWNRLRVEHDTWRSLVHLRFNQDTENADYKRAREYCDEITPKLIEVQVEMKRRLLKSPFQPAIEARFGAQLFALWKCDLASFEPVIADDLVAEAKLEAEYTELSGGARFPFRGETLNLSSVRKYQTSPDRQTRHDVLEAQWGWFEQNGETLDDLYDRLVKLRTSMARKLGYDNYVPLGYARMGRVDYNQADVDRYRRQVRDHVVPLAAKIRAAQAKRLGLEKLNLWDEPLHDLGGNPAPKGDRAWMVDRATEMFDAMHPELAGLFRLMNDRELLDLDTRDGKSPGGFCTGLPVWGVPFIFANFTGTKHDSEVFTHEMGHAFQAWQSRNQPVIDYHWPTSDGAEIHSMSLEFLCMPYIDKFFGDDAARFDRVHLIESILFLPYGVAVDHFQHLVYASPDATPAERHAMWREMEKTYLPWRDHGDIGYTRKGGLWQNQRHIYLAPFYYIDYTLAQVCALQFWVRSKADYGKALADYVTLCERGGSLPFQSLARSAGLISPFDEGCLNDVVDEAARVLDL